MNQNENFKKVLDWQFDKKKKKCIGCLFLFWPIVVDWDNSILINECFFGREKNCSSKCKTKKCTRIPVYN